MKFKKIAIWTVVVVTLIVTALSYPAYRQVRIWRANSMASEAEMMLATPETISRAWELAHAANSLNPNSISIARTLARVYSAGDPATAYPFWEKVVELSDHSPEDRLELARAYLQARLWSEFEAEVSAQRNEGFHPEQLDYLQVLAATLQGKYEQALKMASTLVEKDDAPEEADALFFQLTRLFQELEVRRAGIEHLRQIVTNGGTRKFKALATLARLPDLEIQDIHQLLAVIEESQGPSREVQLLAEELHLRLPKADHREIYTRASHLFQLSDPVEMATFGRWLNQQGLYQFTRLAIPVETAMKRQDLFLILLDSMALENEWEAIRSLLEAPRVPLEGYLVEFFKMRTYSETGQMRLARLAWDRALVATGRDSVKLYYLARKARVLKLELVPFESIFETLIS